MTYEEWFALYLQLYKRSIRPKTRESYDRLHQLIMPILGAMQLDQITPDDVQLAILSVEDRAGSRQAQLAYALIHAVLRRACRSRRLQYNPADGVDRPEHDAQQGRAIEGEAWRILQPIIDDDLAFALMARAGLRRGELLGLRWGDVDLPLGVIHVRRQLVRVDGQLKEQPTKSSAGLRDVPIEPRLMAEIRRCYRLAPNHRIVSCAPETLARRWKRAQEAAGIQQPYRLHDLRHTYATNMLLAGCKPRVLQYMIGHSSLDLTMTTYAHVGAMAAVEEVNRIAGFLH